MSHEKKVVEVQILDRKFQIKCLNEQAEALQQSADYLNEKMKEIHEQSKAIGNERVAIMAALNITFELMTAQRKKDLYLDVMSDRIQTLQKKVESAIALHEPDIK